MSGLAASLANVFRAIGHTVDISLQPSSFKGELWTVSANRGIGQGETLEEALANWAKDTARRND